MHLRTSRLSALRASGRLIRMSPTPSAGRSTSTTGAVIASFLRFGNSESATINERSVCDDLLLGEAKLGKHRFHACIILFELGFEAVAGSEIVRQIIALEIGFPLGRSHHLLHDLFPVCGLWCTHAFRSHDATPAAEHHIDALFFPRRYGGIRAGQPLTCRDADDAQLAGLHLVRDIARRGGYQIDVAAQ